MRRAILLPLLLVAACATTPMSRAYQYGVAIKSVNEATVTALDFGVIKADEGEAIQAATRTATADLKRAVVDIRAGTSRAVVDRILDAVGAALAEAQRILATKGVK